MRPDPWLFIPLRRPDAAVRLVCFSYAGASASCFRGWAAKLPANTELVGIQLPGRENRFAEPLISSAQEAASAAARALAGLGGAAETVFFGHSLGASLAYETAQILHQVGSAAMPRHLIVSGRRAPTVPAREKLLHTMSDAELKRELQDLNCTPPEILENDDLMEMLMPRLRADFAMAENYTHRHQMRLPCPMSAFGGTHDKDVTDADILAWSAMTSGPFSFHAFEGDHFFIHASEAAVLAHIARVIASILTPQPA